MNWFLLVGNPRDSWRKVLQEAVKPLGELDACREAEAYVQAFKRKYKVIIIDTSVVDHPEELVFQLRVDLPLVRLVVVTAAPDWKPARRAFLSGATDYARKEDDKQKLSIFMNQLLERPAASSGRRSGRVSHD